MSPLTSYDACDPHVALDHHELIMLYCLLFLHKSQPFAVLPSGRHMKQSVGIWVSPAGGTGPMAATSSCSDCGSCFLAASDRTLASNRVLPLILVSLRRMETPGPWYIRGFVVGWGL